MRSDILNIIARVLTAILIAMAAVVLVGTICALLCGKTSVNSRRTSNAYGKESAPVSENAYYAGIGMLRIPTADDPPKTLLLAPQLKYDTSDKTFEEELLRKNSVFRDGLISTLSSYTARQIRDMSEKSFKKLITAIINERLTLGAIDAVYFDEYIILD